MSTLTKLAGRTSLCALLAGLTVAGAVGLTAAAWSALSGTARLSEG